MKNFNFLILIIALLQIHCAASAENTNHPPAAHSEASPTMHISTLPPLRVGAARTSEYVPLLRGQNIALVVNQTSMIGKTHLADSLMTLGIKVKKIFAPEHGFRGTADAGEQIKDGRDQRTGVPVVSLYGRKKQPTAADLEGIDWIVFDIQDVGARFYTYISSMHYVMESCALYGVKFMVLDRPNPNGNYVDGPVLQPAFQSFVGMHPVPVVHGMTMAEYAQMINGERWLKDGRSSYLHVVTCENYAHDRPYELPIPPSPNLPNQRAIYLYPSLCFFEGTTVSAGRGTDRQFQIYGHPDAPVGDYTFRPTARPGAKYPKFEDKMCRGFDLTDYAPEQLYQRQRLELSQLVEFYRAFADAGNADAF
ncbi:MAG: DUF1343 domain-containing protein, partial [Bacteroidota bacterium]